MSAHKRYALHVDGTDLQFGDVGKIKQWLDLNTEQEVEMLRDLVECGVWEPTRQDVPAVVVIDTKHPDVKGIIK